MAIGSEDDALGVDLYLIEHRLRDLALDVERVPMREDYPRPEQLALQMTNLADSVFRFTSGRTIARPHSDLDVTAKPQGWVLVE